MRIMFDTTRTVCKFCQMDFGTESELAVHEASCDKRNEPCRYCGLAFINPEDRINHEQICPQRRTVGQLVVKRKGIEIIEMPRGMKEAYKKWLREIRK